MSKIEKVEDVTLKVPLGCVYVTKEGSEMQSNDALFIGPYITWGDTIQSANVTKMNAGGDAVTTVCDGSDNATEEDIEGERLKVGKTRL